MESPNDGADISPPALPEDNCKLTTIEKIDFVLKFLAKPENKGRYHSINDINIGELKWFNRPSFYDSITREDLIIVVIKLIKEGHIIEFNKFMGNTIDEIRFSTNLFKISFDGLLWLERGGYQGQFDRDNASAAHQATEDQRNKYLLWITFSIGVGTVVAAVYYLLYIFDFYEKHSLNQQHCVYFVSGFAIGLLIWLSTWLLQKMKDKPKKHET